MRMSVEIERKFLVKSVDLESLATKKTRIQQGYLNHDPKRTVRIRITDKQGFITVKGASNASGTTRFEWEREIPKDEAVALLALSDGTVIDKTRFYIPHGAHVFEVDEFYGDNVGLIIAEIELNNEAEHFEKPDWIGEEVTGQSKYYNAYLIQHPFTQWDL